VYGEGSRGGEGRELISLQSFVFVHFFGLFYPVLPVGRLVERGGVGKF